MVSEWITLANIGMLLREINLEGLPRGLFSFSASCHHGHEQKRFLREWLRGSARSKSKFRFGALETYTWHVPPNELSYHLHRHDVRPVTPNHLRRNFVPYHVPENWCDVYTVNPDRFFSISEQMLYADTTECD